MRGRWFESQSCKNTFDFLDGSSILFFAKFSSKYWTFRLKSHFLPLLLPFFVHITPSLSHFNKFTHTQNIFSPSRSKRAKANTHSHFHYILIGGHQTRNTIFTSLDCEAEREREKHFVDSIKDLFFIMVVVYGVHFILHVCITTIEACSLARTSCAK